ncbi:MAG: SPFH domain-containing protein [Candidatus Coatesbacteria bacterium]|nr:SPFH domain-containing protein [Candidatus Coatesbacteria bacterium]
MNPLNLMEIIEYHDPTGDEIVHKIPEYGSAETKIGSQLIVLESQSAVFFRDGKALDTFGAGRHTLTTTNLPLIAGLIGKAFDGRSPFRTEVFFVNQKVFTDLKWGTKEPILYRDAEFKMIRLRAFGSFSIRVIDPFLFINKMVGTMSSFTKEDIESFLKGIILARLTDFLGENLKSILDLGQYFDEIGVGVKSRVIDDFGKYGLEAPDFLIQSISVPEEVQKMIDARSSMSALGNMNEFMQFQAAKSMEEAAKNQSGGAGMGMGMGAGIGMGMILPGMVQQANQQQQQSQTPKVMVKCVNGHDCPEGTKFCPECGGKVITPGKANCISCNAEIKEGAKFCPECGAKQTMNCPSCNAEIKPGVKFCPECGAKL